MSFETGGDMQDPFAEEESEDIEEEEKETSGESKAKPEATVETTEADPTAKDLPANDTGEETNQMVTQLETDTIDATSSAQPTKQDLETPYIKDLDITQSVSTIRLARALMVPAYHEENPPVPYSVWRDGTSTGRGRTTIELNSDMDELVKQALREFNNRYDADIHKADVRELALAYGLAHLDDVFAMAEEWGIQYNS